MNCRARNYGSPHKTLFSVERNIMRHRHNHIRIASFAAALLAVSAGHADETTIRIEAEQVLGGFLAT